MPGEQQAADGLSVNRLSLIEGDFFIAFLQTVVVKSKNKIIKCWHVYDEVIRALDPVGEDH